MFLRLSLLSTSDLQQSCLNVLSGTQVLRNVSVCYMYMYYIFFKEKCRKLILRYCFNSNFEKYLNDLGEKLLKSSIRNSCKNESQATVFTVHVKSQKKFKKNWEIKNPNSTSTVVGQTLHLACPTLTNL